MVAQTDLNLFGEALSHLKINLIAGFASASGNGSGAITGLSAAVDAPIKAVVLSGSASTNADVSTGSVTFVSNRVQLSNVTSTNKSVVVFWWDRS